MSGAIWWGAFTASSLVLGAVLALLRSWPERVIGLVLAFGAGALVSAVSFELFEDGIALGGGLPVGLGLGAGALTSSSTASSNPSTPPATTITRARPAPASRSVPSSTGSPSSWCSASVWPPARA